MEVFQTKIPTLLSLNQRAQGSQGWEQPSSSPVVIYADVHRDTVTATWSIHWTKQQLTLQHVVTQLSRLQSPGCPYITDGTSGVTALDDLYMCETGSDQRTEDEYRVHAYVTQGESLDEEDTSGFNTPEDPRESGDDQNTLAYEVVGHILRLMDIHGKMQGSNNSLVELLQYSRDLHAKSIF